MGKQLNLFVHASKFEFDPKIHGEHPTGESMTVPDETLTIREIMEKHIRGQKLADELYRQPIYESDESEDFDREDIEKLSQADLFDRELEIDRLKKQIEKQKTFIQSIQLAVRQDPPDPATKEAPTPTATDEQNERSE